METTATTQPVPTTMAAFADDDPRAVFGRAVALGSAVIAAVRPDQLAEPTPCDEFDVRHLLAHLVLALDRVATVGRGDDPFSVVDPLDEVVDDRWGEAWAATAHEVMRVWADDRVLVTDLRLPWTTLPGAEALAVYTNEITVHTWDLATATGQTPAWDPSVLEVAFAAMQRELPAEGRIESFEAARQAMPPEAPAFGPPFAAAIEVAADAPLIDRLVAFNGRQP